MSNNQLTINLYKATPALENIHFSKENKIIVQQLLKEFKHLNILKKYNLPVDNKLLLHGHTGCGKTTTAIAIAKALDKKIVIIDLGSIVSSKLGETAKNIATVFKKAELEKSVIFLDEFDYLGKSRDNDSKDSGEMKRLVNAIIQRIDYLNNETLLIAATNHFDAIDTALLRRFQLKLKFELPNKKQLDNFYNELLTNYPKKYHTINRLYGFSYAEAKDLLFRALKIQIITDEENATQINAKNS